MSTTEEKINQMYDAQFKSQKERLDTDYANANSDLDAQQKKNQQYTDTNLNRTAVESQKAAVNNAELHNAYGLSSGTRAQARLAQENQLQADMTAIRTAQQNADADVERQRSVLAQEYASAIRQAQAENDMAKAQALYESAKEEEARLLAKQEAAAKDAEAKALAAAELMASTGDFSRLGALYGLSAKEIAALSSMFKTESGYYPGGGSGTGATTPAPMPDANTVPSAPATKPNAPVLPAKPNAPGVPVDFSENSFNTLSTDRLPVRQHIPMGGNNGSTSVSGKSLSAGDGNGTSERLSESRRDEIYNWLEGYFTNRYLPSNFDPNRLISGSGFLTSDKEREYARELVRYIGTL